MVCQYQLINEQANRSYYSREKTEKKIMGWYTLTVHSIWAFRFAGNYFFVHKFTHKKILYLILVSHININIWHDVCRCILRPEPSSRWFLVNYCSFLSSVHSLLQHVLHLNLLFQVACSLLRHNVSLLNDYTKFPNWKPNSFCYHEEILIVWIG